PARVQEIVVFVIVAVTLAVSVRRSNALLVSHAGIERERSNLARYFSPIAARRSPARVIMTLRQFHERMEREIFRHGGTLDKYLGDGLMATFGTPFAGDCDACNALRCAQAMLDSVDELNRERKPRGEP